MNLRIFFSCLFTGIIMFAFGIGLGQEIGKQGSQKQIVELQKSLDYCETMWKLDAELFFPNLCKTVCVEEFEKMSC